MNPHIGDMRRAREMKEFVHKRKLQLSGAKNREVIPELRSIPLTFLDCPEQYEVAGCVEGTESACGAWLEDGLLLVCEWCVHGINKYPCPRGFP
jgi:hypothetical protein